MHSSAVSTRIRGESAVRYLANPWMAKAASLKARFRVGLSDDTTAASTPQPAISVK